MYVYLYYKGTVFIIFCMMNVGLTGDELCHKTSQSIRQSGHTRYYMRYVIIYAIYYNHDNFDTESNNLAIIHIIRLATY